ncbi:hypothetical protein LTR33_006683 [Friedmanniomyces endolithicus]|nr:hypothetical protein LTR33_006683 [Friedmanniomyces endolithicus]
MTCPSCSTDFCYLCGQQAGPHSRHWGRAGGCPYFGQPRNDVHEAEDNNATIDQDTEGNYYDAGLNPLIEERFRLRVEGWVLNHAVLDAARNPWYTALHALRNAARVDPTGRESGDRHGDLQLEDRGAREPLSRRLPQRLRIPSFNRTSWRDV